MPSRAATAIVLVSLLNASWAPELAHAENQMGYRLLSAQDASGLPHNHGALGLDVERAQQITNDGMTFDIIRVKAAKPGSAAAKAGFRTGDQIIAVDGRVFPSIAAFAAYVGSIPPGDSISIDYMPAGGGPGNAERVAVTLTAAGRPPAADRSGDRGRDDTSPTGMSTRMKIGIGAAALLGCYELGCFSRSKPGGYTETPQPQTSPAPQR